MTLNNELQHQIYESLKLKDTDDLIEIWKTNDRAAWSKEAFLAIQVILQERLGSVPIQGAEKTNEAGEDEEEDDVEDAGEYPLITPSVLKAFLISCIILSFGVLIKSISTLMYRYPEDQFLTVSGIVMIIAGVTGSFVYGLMSLIESGDIIRFRPIQKIALSQSGFTFIEKDQSIDRKISWQQIKSIQIQGLKHLILFVIQTSWEPIGLTLNLMDGSKVQIPIGTILKQEDCRRLVRTLARYGSSIVQNG